MRDSQARPLLPKWPFYLSNILLVLFAIFLAFRARDNLSATHIFWCICSVFLGALLFLYPFSQEFKAYMSLQKLRHTALTKEQAQRLDHTLSQLQDIKESIFENHHKQSLDQNLISSTLQSLEERLNKALEHNLNFASMVLLEKSDLEGIETRLQSLTDVVHAGVSYQAIVDGERKHAEQKACSPIDSLARAVEKTAADTAELISNPLPAFFREQGAGTSSADRIASNFNPLDATLEALAPEAEMLVPEAEIDKSPRQWFAEEKESISLPNDHPFTFDFEDLVPQNLFNPRQNTPLMHQEESPKAILSTAYAGPQDAALGLGLLGNREPSAIEETSVSVAVAEPTVSLEEQVYNPAQGTSLTVHANLGIGKKPYIRGQGPGLNWGYGVPMAFLEMGKWQWTAPDSSQPIICRIYKNDEIPAEGEVLCLQPGEQAELNPVFRA